MQNGKLTEIFHHAMTNTLCGMYVIHIKIFKYLWTATFSFAMHHVTVNLTYINVHYKYFSQHFKSSNMHLLIHDKSLSSTLAWFFHEYFKSSNQKSEFNTISIINLMCMCSLSIHVSLKLHECHLVIYYISTVYPHQEKTIKNSRERNFRGCRNQYKFQILKLFGENPYEIMKLFLQISYREACIYR